MAELLRVRSWANALITLHLDPAIWSFGFDNAKTRAGQCNYTLKHISVSRYLAARYEDDEIHQVLLHEIAHAMAGSRAGHGPKWRAVAKELGYEGKRLHIGETASELAPWLGTCPAGHLYYRFRKPARATTCSVCSPRFDRAHVIDWHKREISAASRRAAATPR
ncbi:MULTISPECIES: SprT-like domain-containing protein [Subtercola]|uniref:M48 family peptidase n=1 Tax=Subtercola vilae TaxID=2056433 RepID=A0A4V6U5G9_9MICO|nr:MULTISPECIES: SprT-like domain-containing protein [Subtercola]MEA9984584.1 SprT-like domain-containing protein [Subtercola sp. RTI3]TIH39354.1 M48 family peptidase [Subtercola vilae]